MDEGNYRLGTIYDIVVVIISFYVFLGKWMA
jgi:hypothetical protein